MDGKYIISIYQKIELSENIILFKRVNVVKDATIKFEDDFYEATYYDESRKRVILDSMDSDYSFVSDDQYCYGYPMTIESLKSYYPEINDDNLLMEKYLYEMSKVVTFAYYNEALDKVKILSTNETMLDECDEDQLFNMFEVDYESYDEKVVEVQLSDLNKMMNLIEKKKYAILKESIEQLINNVYEEYESVDKKTRSDISSQLNKKKEEDETKEDVLEKLDNLIGLDNIKEAINKLVKYLDFKDKSKKYLNLEQPKLHMFFMGNPGTGKTTVAKIISKLLYKMGYIEKDSYIEVTPKDLMGEYVGHTAPKTEELIKKNKGGVILIDEAYGLANDGQQFGKDALDVILTEMDKNETVFIFAGYKKEMEKILKLNSGFTSRVDFCFDFNDYTKEELYQIFEEKIEKIGFIIDDELKEKVLNNLENAKIEENFGNGRYVDKLIRSIIFEHSLNTERYTRKKELITLTKYDLVEENEQVSLNDIMSKLDDLTGLENVKSEITDLTNNLIFKEKTDKYLDLKDLNLSMVFTGNPGTGKTTVARIISELLFKLGYTKNKKFIEITTKDLIGEYVGQTAPKTAELLKKHRGGVIFIDEAYTLTQNSSNGYEQEALSEILKEMEKRQTVFIFAGYKKEMNDFVNTNPGLQSRIGYYINFEDYTIDQLYEIFETKVTKMGYVIDDKLKEIIINNIKTAKENEHFGNGRYIDKLIDKLQLQHSNNVLNYTRKDKLITLTQEDFSKKVEEKLLVKTNNKSKLGF